MRINGLHQFIDTDAAFFIAYNKASLIKLLLKRIWLWQASFQVTIDELGCTIQRKNKF